MLILSLSVSAVLGSGLPESSILALLLQNALPDVLCVVQVALEGAVSKKAALNSLAQGNLPQVMLMKHFHFDQSSILPSFPCLSCPVNN